MKSRIRAVVWAAGAAGTLGLFLVGVPVCLIRLVGNPLPGSLPGWAQVVETLSGGPAPDVIVGVLAIAVWIWWSQAALSFLTALWASCRGRSARALPLRGLGMQPVMVRLVAMLAAAAATAVAVTQPALAASPSFAEITVPLSPAPAVGHPAVAEPPEPTDFSPLGAVAPAGAATLGINLPAPPVLEPPQHQAATAPVLGLPSAAVPEWLPPPDHKAASDPLGVSAPLPGAELQPSSASPRSAQTGETGPPLAPIPSEGFKASVLGGRVEPAVGEAIGPATSPDDPVEGVMAAADRVRLSAAASSGAEQAPADPLGAPTHEAAGWVIVKPGDSLWRLAEEHLGDAWRWQDIFDLNEGPLDGGGTLRDPNLIHPGWRLRLPPVSPTDLRPDAQHSVANQSER